MRTRWRLLGALLIAGALIFAIVYCGLFDWVLYQTHTAVEAVLGETPQNKVEAYLSAVHRGDREAALACWPANERLGVDHEARRQQVTDELLALGSSLRHRVLEVEWWSGCCEPSPLNDPAIAGMARMQVEIMDDQDRPQQYVFDVVTTRPYWGAAGGPVRRWVLQDAYPAGERPLAFPWPLPTPTPVPAVTLSGREGDISTWQTYQVKAWPLTFRHPPGWSVEEKIPADEDVGPFVWIRAGGRELVIIRSRGLPEDLPPLAGEDAQMGDLGARKYISRDENGAPRWVVVIPTQASNTVSGASYSLAGLPEDETYMDLFDSILASIKFGQVTETVRTPTAQPPEAVMAAWYTLVGQLRVQDMSEVRLLRWEKVDWPDSCLGIPRRDACTEAVVPGYRIVVEVGGREYEYRSTLPDAQPYRLLLAAGPDHGIEEPSLVWEGQEDNGCQSLLLAADGRAAIGPCDAPQTPLCLSDGMNRLQQWSHLLARFAPFRADTPARQIIFRGQGTEIATPAWQRAIAAWARLVRLELQMERSGASWGTALSWRREVPEHPEYCKFLQVEVYGMAYASLARCDGGDARGLGQGWLATAEWEQFDAWLHERARLDLPGLLFLGTGSQDVSESEVADLRHWAEAVYGRLAACDLTVEEYPIVAQDMDSPGHFEYFQRIPAEILEKRQTWRNPTPEGRVAEINQALASFGYRLAPKEKPSWPHPLYDLYRGNKLVYSDLMTVWPVAVTSAGDDFALLAEELNAPTILVRREAVEWWDAAGHAFIPPVFVGDGLVAVETDEQHQQFAVRRGNETLYTFTVPGPRVDNPVKGLWSWMGHWVLEVDGQVLVDGKSLNEELGYDEIFGWQFLGGRPFYFFKKDNHVGVSYGGQVLPYQYDEVVHYRCCEPAAFNVAGNETMVWFHALRKGMWYYVEMGVYRHGP